MSSIKPMVIEFISNADETTKQQLLELLNPSTSTQKNKIRDDTAPINTPKKAKVEVNTDQSLEEKKDKEITKGTVHVFAIGEEPDSTVVYHIPKRVMNQQWEDDLKFVCSKSLSHINKFTKEERKKYDEITDRIIQYASMWGCIQIKSEMTLEEFQLETEGKMTPEQIDCIKETRYNGKFDVEGGDVCYQVYVCK
jgi:hypothetical protein